MTAEPVTANHKLAAQVVRGLAMDAVQKADSGHPGLPMGMADIAVALWLDHLRYDVADSHWAGRDRFVLSAGHGSMLLYSLLHLAGFDVTMEDLQSFRQLHSRTPGHPELGVTEGVETTTGPLGQGVGNAVGMALAARMEAARFGCPELDAHRVIAIVSDGDMMEGVASEACSLAGHLRLSNLVFFYDDNHITIDGTTSLSFSEDVGRRFEAYGWRALHLADGHDPDAIDATMKEAFAAGADRPTIVVCRTHIGYGSPNKQDKSSAHGSPLGAEEVARAKVALGLPDEAFWVPDDVRAEFRAAGERKAREARAWRERFAAWEKAHPAEANELAAFRARTLPDDLFEKLCDAVGEDDGATRALSSTVIQRAAELVPSLVTGSADLNASCKTAIKTSGDVKAGDYGHRNLHFGIREHAMGAILNGLAIHGGLIPVGSTFLVFSDYMRPSIRLAALMSQPVIYVFSHDSLYVGEDGPTHEPVEQAIALRVIPHVHVWRPADGLEVAAAWTHALTRDEGPVAILVTRQGLPRLLRRDGFDRAELLRGAYVLHEPTETARGTVIATGSEVSVTLDAARILAAEGLHLRVVSMPCIETFTDQPRDYRDAVLPRELPVFGVELGRPESLCQFTGSLDHVIGFTRFGASAPWQDLRAEFGFDADGIAAQLRAMAS